MSVWAEYWHYTPPESRAFRVYPLRSRRPDHSTDTPELDEIAKRSLSCQIPQTVPRDGDLAILKTENTSRAPLDSYHEAKW